MRKKKSKRTTPARKVSSAEASARISPAEFAYIGAQELCELTGLTDRRHRQLAKEGWFPAKSAEGWQKEPTVAGLFKYFRELLHRKNDAAKIEEAKYKKAKREMTEEELAILRGQYVPKAEIGPALRNLALHQRATLQFKLEQEIAPGLLGKTAQEILEEHRRAVDEICKVFEDGIRNWCEAPPEACGKCKIAGGDAGAPGEETWSI